jgi:hypothetical protein
MPLSRRATGNSTAHSHRTWQCSCRRTPGSRGYNRRRRADLHQTSHRTPKRLNHPPSQRRAAPRLPRCRSPVRRAAGGPTATALSLAVASGGPTATALSLAVASFASAPSDSDTPVSAASSAATASSTSLGKSEAASSWESPDTRPPHAKLPTTEARRHPSPRPSLFEDRTLTHRGDTT